MMKLERSSGTLLHITSLPGKHGIGTLGPEARDFAGRLRDAGMRYWQILPIGPVDAKLDYSPYASTSAFAGNWHFISLERLAEEKWFSGTIGAFPVKEGYVVSFEEVIAHKLPILEKACGDFFSHAAGSELNAYKKFCDAEANWLDDFALFSAIAEQTGTTEWLKWDENLSMREPGTLEQRRKKLGMEVRFHSFIQYLFFRQWADFRND
jgi:4-alpha-glucanotransferase